MARIILYLAAIVAAYGVVGHIDYEATQATAAIVAQRNYMIGGR